MAECLVPGEVPASAITAIYVGSNEARDTVVQMPAKTMTVPVVVEPAMFFQPRYRSFVTPRLTLAQGDMFFSRMQTLTVSVNTVGVMGKGVASQGEVAVP